MNIVFSWRTLAFGILITGLVVAGLLAFHYRNNAMTYKKQRDEKTQALASANNAISDMQMRQHNVAVLDAKYTKELADAKRTIADLQRDVERGAKRLRVSATCPRMPDTSATAGMADAAPAGLTDAAGRDYFTLRRRIETARSQIAGLQDYIRNVCLK